MINDSRLGPVPEGAVPVAKAMYGASNAMRGQPMMTPANQGMDQVLTGDPFGNAAGGNAAQQSEQMRLALQEANQNMQTQAPQMASAARGMAIADATSAEQPEFRANMLKNEFIYNELEKAAGNQDLISPALRMLGQANQDPRFRESIATSRAMFG